MRFNSWFAAPFFIAISPSAQPDRTEKIESRDAYLWIVPARFAGAWHVDSGQKQFQIVLRQRTRWSKALP